MKETELKEIETLIIRKLCLTFSVYYKNIYKLFEMKRSSEYYQNN